MTFNVSGMSNPSGLITFNTRVYSNPYGGNMFCNPMFGMNSGYNISNVFNLLPYMFQNMSLMNNDRFNFNGMYGYPQYPQIPQISQQSVQQPTIQKTDEVKKTTSKPVETDLEKEALKKEGAEIAREIYESIKGFGTNVDKLNSSVNKITKDNVVYVISAWDLNFKNAYGDGSIIDAIQNDTSFGTQKRIEKVFTKALTSRAAELGLTNEANSAKGVVNAEHNSMFYFASGGTTVSDALENLSRSIENCEKKLSWGTIGTVDDTVSEKQEPMYIPYSQFMGIA